MKIKTGFDKESVSRIAKESGSAAVRGSVSYISAPFIKDNSNFVCEVFDGVAFFAGTICKDHFRLYEIAVTKENQNKGYGKAMIARIKFICRQKNVPKITLRTSKDETAIAFYRKLGGKIVGEKENDWEVELKA